MSAIRIVMKQSSKIVSSGSVPFVKIEVTLKEKDFVSMSLRVMNMLPIKT